VHSAYIDSQTARTKPCDAYRTGLYWIWNQRSKKSKNLDPTPQIYWRLWARL